MQNRGWKRHSFQFVACFFPVDPTQTSCLTGAIGDTYCQTLFADPDTSCTDGVCVCDESYHMVYPDTWSCAEGEILVFPIQSCRSSILSSSIQHDPVIIYQTMHVYNCPLVHTLVGKSTLIRPYARWVLLNGGFKFVLFIREAAGFSGLQGTNDSRE